MTAFIKAQPGVPADRLRRPLNFNVGLQNKAPAPHIEMRPFLDLLILVALFCVPSFSNASSDDWPPITVKYEDVQPKTKFRLFIPHIVVKGRVSGPAILKVHIATNGSVAKAVLLSSCGNPDLDEAALHGMREMRFEPYALDGEPQDVSLLLPVHIPRNFGRRD